jgi:hypothetical protein
VSVGALAALSIWIHPREILTAATPAALRALTPALLLYAAVTLVIEARCLVRLCPPDATPLSLWTAARIKAASYLVQVLHYALGVGALAYLLQRRTRISTVHAAGITLLISFLDLAVLLSAAALAILEVPDLAPDVRVGVLGGLAASALAGILLLRAGRSLGPLDRLRDSTAFAAARETPGPALIEVGLLRVLLVSAFIALSTVALRAFNIVVPLGPLVLSVVLLALVSALPIAMAGLGTGQAAFLYLFRGRASPETLLACSLTLSAGLLLVRFLLGFAFAREYGREALTQADPNAASWSEERPEP